MDGRSRRRVVLGAILVIALWQMWASRYAMQADGISYLDMGDAMLRGDWQMALNGYWSPLYALLLGLAMRVVHPDANWQFTVVHIVNFLIFAFALASLDYLLRIMRLSFALGYSIFGYLALTMIGMDRVSPDMLMAAFVFLCLGMLKRIRAGQDGTIDFALLGIALAFAYLSKAPMLPLGALIACMALYGKWNRVIALGVPFVLIAGSWIAAISVHSRRFTVSDSGRVNFIAQINGAGPGWYFQSPGTAAGNYEHPVRRIHDRPVVYEFAAPLKGTQAIWYDPSYWTAGVHPRLVLGAWIRNALRQLRTYGSLIIHWQWILIAGFAAAVALGGRLTWREPELWILATAGLAMYAAIVVEPRYVAVCFTLLWLALLSSLREPPRFEICVTVGLLIALSVFVAREQHATDVHLRLASELRTHGIREGDLVARIGGLYSADWARLLGVRVVAEVPESEAKLFWSAGKAGQDETIRVFQRLGVRAIIAERPGNRERFTILLEP